MKQPTGPLAAERTSSEELLAAALRATTDLRVRLTERPGIAVGDPAVGAAIRYATARAFSVRELAAWLRENGVPISPTHVFRKSESGRAVADSSPYFVEAFQRLEDAVRWVMGMCEHSQETTIVFVNAILGSSSHEDAKPISADELLEASPSSVRDACNDAVAAFLDRVKEGKCRLFAGDIQHVDVLRHVGQAADAEIAGLLKVAREIHRRPRGSIAVRKTRDRSE